MNTPQVKEFLISLQDSIVKGLEQADGKTFKRDQWDLPEGGGGMSSSPRMAGNTRGYDAPNPDDGGDVSPSYAPDEQNKEDIPF